MPNKEKVLVIVGQTAVGKTSMSLKLASFLNGEIINGDAMQVYKNLNIVTDKIKKEKMGNIPHHLFDIKEIDEDYSVYLDAVKEYSHLKEGSMRCYKCYEFRLKLLSKYASINNFDYYSTVMSVSPYKSSKWINELGLLYQDKSIFLYSNFTILSICFNLDCAILAFVALYLNLSTIAVNLFISFC